MKGCTDEVIDIVDDKSEDTSIMKWLMWLPWSGARRLWALVWDKGRNKNDLSNENVVRLEHENDRLRQKHAENIERLQHHADQIQELQQYIVRLELSNEGLKKDLEIANTRLSAQLAVSVREGNPNIVNLNDPYRSTKVAELYSELYDNEWTTAFDRIEKDKPDGRYIIDMLLDILNLCYTYCDKTVDDKWNTFETWFLDKNDSSHKEIRIKLQDDRKRLLIQQLDQVSKKFSKTIVDKYPIFESEELGKYITTCVKVCLLMSACVPKLVLVSPGALLPTSDEGQHERVAFDKKLYREYVTRGPYVTFCVWPALCQSNDMSVLCKGVAEATKEG